MGVQISSVRFLCSKMHLFQTKWMNRSIKVLSIAAYYFFPSLNFRISSRKNDSSLEAIQSNFRFLRKKWTGDLLHPSKQPVIRRSNVKNTADAVKHPIWAFPNILYFSDMRPSVVMKKNNFILSLLVFRPQFFSQFTAQTNQL